LDINKLVLSLDAFPLNFRFLRNFYVNIGSSCSCLLMDLTTGYEEQSQMSDYSYWVIEKGTWDKSKRITVGMTGRLSYSIPLSNNWYIMPQVSCYLGLISEFKSTVMKGRTFKPYLEIQLNRKL